MRSVAPSVLVIACIVTWSSTSHAQESPAHTGGVSDPGEPEQSAPGKEHTDQPPPELKQPTSPPDPHAKGVDETDPDDKGGTDKVNDEKGDREKVDGAKVDGAKSDRAKSDRAKSDRAKRDRAKKPENKLSRPGKPKGPTDRIIDIVVEDNTKTTDDTVILVSGVSKGDSFNPYMVEQIKANLVDSGLFKSVQVSYKKLSAGYRLHFETQDKQSWIVAPTYYNQPTNKGFGLGFGENNLFGENEKLLLYGQLATGDSFFIGAYIDPSIAGSRYGWQLDSYLLSERVIEYKPPKEWRDMPEEARLSRLVYLNVGMSYRINFTRRFGADLRIRGAKVAYEDTRLADAAMLSDVTGDPMATPDNIPDPGKSGYDVSAEVKLEYDSRANWYGVTHGSRLRLSFEYALPDLYSDFEYWYATLNWQRARRYFSRHNLILKAQLGYGQNMPFQHEFTSGGTDLRGFKNVQYRGDARAAATLEYSVPMFTIKGVSFRALAFGDSAYTVIVDADNPDNDFRNYLPGQGTRGYAPWKNTVGLGIRMHMRQIVLPLLGVDFGYGIEREAAEIYLAIGLTDV